MTELDYPILTSGYPLGSSAGLVAAFEWLGLPHRLTRVDMFGEMRADAYRRLNGRVETPFLVMTDGRILTETMAIALWLEHRDPERRISFEPGTREADRMHQLMAFVNTSFTASFMPLWAALEADGMSEAARDALRAFGRHMVTRRHEQLEELIGDGPYLAGGKRSLADAVFAGVARWADFHEVVERGRYPRIEALRRRVETDPAFEFALAIESGQQAPGSGTMKGMVPLGELMQAAILVA